MSRVPQSRANPEHRALAELLPWYVNGTLEGAELESFERHLETCVACATELEGQEQLARWLRTSDELAFSAARGFEKLRRRLDEAERPEEAASDGERRPTLARRLREQVGRLGTPVRWALAAQAIAIVLLAGTLWVSGEGAPGEGAAGGTFHTLTESPRDEAGEAPRLRAVFDATAREGDIRELLTESGAGIVAGPSRFGVYTLEVAAGGDPAGILDRLRSSNLVVFVEPVSR